MRSRIVPRQIRVAPASEAMVAPKKRKMPIAVIPVCDSSGRTFPTHVENNPAPDDYNSERFLFTSHSKRGAMYHDRYLGLADVLGYRVQARSLR